MSAVFSDSFRFVLMRGHPRWDETTVPWKHLNDDGITDDDDDSDDDDENND